MDLGTVVFEGQSGRKYEFKLYTLDTNFKALGAVYVFGDRKLKTDGWYFTSLYFGQTGDLSQRFTDHHRQACVDRHGANCIGVHLDADERSRLAKEADLIRRWNPVCNG